MFHCCCCCNFGLSQLVILSPDAAGERAALHRQRSLPHRPPVIPLVARMADQNTSGTPAMTEREASRLDKFKQLLAGPNTDLGKTHSPDQSPLVLPCVLRRAVFGCCLYSSSLLSTCVSSHLRRSFSFFLPLLCFVACPYFCQLHCAFNDAVSG